MAVGNKHIGYKEALNSIEAVSPGSKHAFYHEFLSKAAAYFDGATASASGDVGQCKRCGSPSTNEICAFCQLIERSAGAEPVTINIRKKTNR